MPTSRYVIRGIWGTFEQFWENVHPLQTCHVSRVKCHVSFLFYFFFGQSGEAFWWRVCYQRGLPLLVYKEIGIFEKKGFFFIFSFFLIIFEFFGGFLLIFNGFSDIFFRFFLIFYFLFIFFKFWVIYGFFSKLLRFWLKVTKVTTRQQTGLKWAKTA